MHAKAEANIAEGVLGWSSKAQELFIKVVTTLYCTQYEKISDVSFDASILNTSDLDTGMISSNPRSRETIPFKNITTDCPQFPALALFEGKYCKESP